MRERAGEIAVLKAIGFGRRVIFGTLLAEAVVLSTVAGRLGVRARARPDRARCAAVAGWNDALGPLGSFIVTAPVIVAGRRSSRSFVGMLAGVVPSWGAARKPVVRRCTRCSDDAALPLSYSVAQRARRARRAACMTAASSRWSSSRARCFSG